jgi:SAM-dependent methyltransferase
MDKGQALSEVFHVSITEQFSLLSDPVRVRALCLLRHQELAVGEIGRVLDLPQSSVSRHSKALHTAGWLTRRTEGTSTRLSFQPDALTAEQARIWALIAADAEGNVVVAEDRQRMEQLVAQREVSSTEYFGQVATQWDRIRTDLYGAGLDARALAALLPPDWVVADLGCGTGALLPELAQGVRRVFGIDRAQEMLDLAQVRTAGLPNVTLRLGGLEDLPLDDGQVDVALCNLVLHHVPDTAAVFAEVARVLKPGGSFVIVDMVAHDRAPYRQTMGHAHLGFRGEDLAYLGEGVGLPMLSHQRLGPVPGAMGPGLFVARFVRT